VGNAYCGVKACSRVE